MSPLLKRTALLFAPVIALLVFTGPASATVTSTNITSPADNFTSVFVTDPGTTQVTISGSAVAANGDKVDIRCYNGTSSSLVSSGLTVNSGSFSKTVVLGTMDDEVCTLRAVPTGTSPTAASQFTGPSTAVSSVNPDDNSGYDFYIGADQAGGRMQYNSAGACGLDNTSVVSPELGNQETQELFNCSEWLAQSNYNDSTSNLKLDGQNAYLPGAIAASWPGFVKPAYNYSFDAANNLVVSEHDKVFVCPGEGRAGGYLSSCPGLVDTGIRLDRTITQDHNGHQSRVTDNWVNTTGAPHSLAMAYAESTGDSSDFRFPNGTVVSNGLSGQTVPGKFPDASSIYVSDTGVADNNPDHARGAITMFPGADSATFGAPNYFEANYSTTIGAGAMYTVDAVFDQAISSADVNSLAASAAKLLTPQPSFGAATTAKATYNKKTKKISLATGQSVVCPARGQACAISGTLTSKIKLPAKKSKKGKKKTKAKYKTYTIGSIAISAAAGTTDPISLVLSKKIAALLIKQKKLNVSFPISVTAGSLASASTSASFTVKAPKIPKPKKHKRKH